MWDAASRHPAAALLAVLALSVFAAAGVPRIDAQVDFVDTVPDHEGLEPYRDMLERLDGVRFVALYMPHDPDHPSQHLRDEAGFEALVQDQEALTGFLHERFPGTFSHTLSVYEGMRAGHYMLAKIATAGNPPEDAYSVPDDPVRFQTVRDQGLQDGSFDDVLAQDGSSSILLAFFATNDGREARELSGAVAQEVTDWSSPTGATEPPQASGLHYASHVVDERNQDDVVFWGLVALGAVAAVLLVLLRRPTNVAIAATSIALATLWTFGTLGWLGLELSFLSVFLAPVVMGVGVDHAVHLLHRIEESGDVAFAARGTGPAVAVAAVTTAAGLAALLFVPAPLFSEIGAIAALGILWSLVAALLFVPAISTWTQRRRRDLPGARGLARFASAAARRPAVPAIIVLLVTAAAVTGAATQTTVESGSTENELPQDDPLVVLQQRIEAEYGAFQRGYIVVRGDLTDPAALRVLLEGSRLAADLPLHRDASSVADLLLADEATDEGAKDIALASVLAGAGQEPTQEQRLPQTSEEARQALDRLFADPLWRTIAPFTITREYDLAVIAVEIEPWQDQAQLRGLRDAMTRLADDLQERLPGHEVRAAGSPVNRAAVIEQTPDDVAIATLGTGAAVFLVLAVAWSRRGLEGLRVAGLGLGMVLVASAWLLASIPILDAVYDATDSANNAALTDMFLLAFAITVAVGIDDLVHIASRFWEARDAGAGKSEALDEAFSHAGRAVTGTTLTTFVAFAVLAGVYFLQSKNLAILTAAGALFAFAITMLLVPRLLVGRA